MDKEDVMYKQYSIEALFKYKTYNPVFMAIQMDLRDVMHMNKFRENKIFYDITYIILKMQVINVHIKHKETDIRNKLINVQEGKGGN